VRASVVAEKMGLPSASVVCSGFAVQGQTSAAGLGMPTLPLAIYPGRPSLHSDVEMKRNVEDVLVEQIVNCLTRQPPENEEIKEPCPKDVVFTGTSEDVNEFFYEQEWGDGLPIVPPTLQEVERFLSYSPRSSGEVLGVLLPEGREATVWNVAVNGVMAGCRPEYMPVLVAIVEALADSNFGHEHLGHTPGTEILVTINGPIIKELGFNSGQGALRVGFQANTSIGRFVRLYLRNVAGFIPHKTDKATFGGTWRVVLAENEDAVNEAGWQPMSVDQGFRKGENVVTLNSCTSTDSVFNVGDSTAEAVLDKLAARLVDIQLHLFSLGFVGQGVRPQILLSPCLAGIIARGGFSKARMKQYLHRKAVFPARRFELLKPELGSFCENVRKGVLPEYYCRNSDPDRLVPLLLEPDDLLITVSGDPERDNCLICAQNGFIGYPTSKRIELPANWGTVAERPRG